MTSVLVNNLFNQAQTKLYAPEEVIDSDDTELLEIVDDQEEQDAIKGKEEITLTSRLKAVPIAVADLGLEVLRSISLVVESAALTAFRLLALPFSLIHGAIQKDFSLARQAIRLTIRNLNDTIYHAVHGALKIALTPLLLIGQIGLLAINPQERRSSNENFKLLSKTTQEQAAPITAQQEKVYTQLNVEASKSSNKGYPSLKARALAVPVAFIDTGLGILKPLEATILGLLALVGTLLYQFPVHLWTAYKGEKDDELTNKTIFVDFLKTLNTTAKAIAETASKIAMSPLTLVAQIAAGVWDPKVVGPSESGLYASQTGDLRFSSNGLEEKTARGDYIAYNQKAVSGKMESLQTSLENDLYSSRT